MASIENRSRFKVTVQNRDDLTETFTHSATEAVKAHIKQLKDGFISHAEAGTKGAASRPAGPRLVAIWWQSGAICHCLQVREMERRQAQVIDLQ
jgi:hypothetical protein